MKERSNFSGRLGFILAAAGSAVGLGNIWRFPYLAAKYGGGIFLLVYILFVISFGFTIMIAEISLGRKTQLSAIGAFKKLNSKYSFIGVLASIVPIIILPYYSVIGGWIIKYLATYIAGNHTLAANDNFFNDFISSPSTPIVWCSLFILMTTIVVILGVKKGIEKANKILMPLLIFLTIAIAIYSITLPGAMEGVKYYFTPDFSKFSVKTVLAAMGQMFYSMSLAMGIMITYGSYINKNTDLEKSVKQIEIFDTGIAILAGLMIVPAVFAFSGGNQDALNAGPGLMFITLPKVFENMKVSSLVGISFFTLVLFAALTSSISLMETIVSILHDKFKWSRLKCSIIVAVESFLIGIPSSLGFGLLKDIQPLNMSILDFFDFISNYVLMPFVALFTCIFIAYIIGTKAIADEIKFSSDFKREKIFNIIIKYIAPVLIIVILISNILSAFNIFKI